MTSTRHFHPMANNYLSMKYNDNHVISIAEVSLHRLACETLLLAGSKQRGRRLRGARLENRRGHCDNGCRPFVTLGTDKDSRCSAPNVLLCERSRVLKRRSDLRRLTVRRYSVRHRENNFPFCLRRKKLFPVLVVAVSLTKPPNTSRCQTYFSLNHD
jgi:hypothetical protein